jgi:hypothetical protein
MFEWLFCKPSGSQTSGKDYSRLIPRIAGLIDGVLMTAPDHFLTPYSAFVLDNKYAVLWTGGNKPHDLQEDEIAVAYLYECKSFDEFKVQLLLSARVGGPAGGHLRHMTVDIISTELSVLLAMRSGRSDINR